MCRLPAICLSVFLLLPEAAGARYRQLQQAQMQQDLSVLRTAWETLHPGIYRFHTQRAVRLMFRQAGSRCRLPMDERRFYILLAQLCRQVHCGHTYLNPLNLPAETKERLLPATVIPFFFEVTANRKIVITHNLSGNTRIKQGDELTAINGIPAQRIIDSLLTVSRSDGRHATGKKLANINETPDEGTAVSLFDIFMPLFFPSPADSFTVAVRPFGNKRSGQYKVAAFSYAQREACYKQLFGPLPEAERSWAYNLPNQHTAYMKFGTFAFWNSHFNETAFIDSCFHDLAQRPEVRNLIIDIRGNEGGDNTGNYILSYITGEPIGNTDPDRPCYRFLGVPPKLLPYLSTWDEHFKDPKDSSRYVRNKLGLYERKEKGSAENLIIPQPQHFKGQVFLLIDAKNSSAGYEMARNFKTARLGTIIGQPTGGCRQGINGGEFFFLTLPNSMFEADLPLIYNYHPGKPDAGITPDHYIPVTQASIAKGRDAVMQFVLRQIKKQTPKRG